MSDAMYNDPRYTRRNPESTAAVQKIMGSQTPAYDVDKYNKAIDAKYRQMVSAELGAFDRQIKKLNTLMGAAVNDPAKLAELQEAYDNVVRSRDEHISSIRARYGLSEDEVRAAQGRERVTRTLAEDPRKDRFGDGSSIHASDYASEDKKENDKKDSKNGDNGSIASSLANYFSSMNLGGKAPGSENLENQASMHDVQAAQEDANAQQNQQIANRDYRGEAEKNAVANAATQNAQTVANLGNASAGAAALERTVGTADYNTHMNRQDEQREKAVEKQREAWGARQTAEEERQAAAAENNDKRNMDMYNSLAKYLSQGAGGNGTDTSTTTEQGDTGESNNPESTNPQGTNSENTNPGDTGEGNNPQGTNPQGGNTQGTNPQGGNTQGTSPQGANTKGAGTDAVDSKDDEQQGTENTQQPTTQQTTTPSASNMVPSVPAVNNVEPDKVNVNAVTDAAGEQPLQNQVVTQEINDAVARKQAYENESEFWNEYTEQIPGGGGNSRKQTHENFVAFQEDNPDEMSKPISEQVSDFIKQDPDSYQNVDIDGILGAYKGKYPPWLVAQAASIRNNAQNGGDRQNADALSERFNQLYYTYTNKNSWYNKLSPQEQKKFNEMYANAPTAEQEAFLSASTDEQQKIYQSWMDGKLVAYGSRRGSTYNTSPAVTDYDAAYKKVYESNPSIRYVLNRLDTLQQQAYIDILNSSYDLNRDEDVKRAEGDLSKMSAGNVLNDLLSKDSQFNNRYNALKDALDKKYGVVQQTDTPAYKGDFSDIGGDEFNDIYASWKQYTPERQKLFDDMDKEGQEHWVRLRTGHASEADARYFAENYNDDELKDFHQFGFGDNMMAEIDKARQKLADENTESDARQKNIIAGCFSRF